jgi:hypothetical protein
VSEVKLKQVVPFSFHLWTTTDAGLKKVQQFFKERNFFGVHSDLYTSQVVEEVLELRAKQGLYSLLIIDEGQIEEFKCFFQCEHTLFFILSSGFYNEVSDKENLFFIDSLDEFFELFGNIYDHCSDNYRRFLIDVGQQNLRNLIKYSSSNEFDQKVKDLTEEQRIPYEVIYEQITSGDFSIPQLLEAIVKGSGVLKEYDREFIETEKFQTLIHLPLYSIVEKNMALFLYQELNFEQILKLRLVLSYYRFLDNRLGDENERESVLNCFPYPMTVIENGDVVFYNQKFLDLNISSREILKLGAQDTLLVDEVTYSLQKVCLNSDRILFLFTPYLLQEREKNISSKELGIITSSIAHELNNPLAGIMSAVTVLEYEDFWSEQDREYLQDIKITTQRCKKIVETFLGFSRSSLPSERECSLCELLEQSLELIRFRSAELDLRLDINIDHCRNRAVHVPGPIFTMFLYLLYSEILTLFNHDKLIAEKGPGEHVIPVVVKSEDQKISLEFSNLGVEVLGKIDSFVSHSKLIDHLLSLLKMNFTFEKNQFRFILQEIS